MGKLVAAWVLAGGALLAAGPGEAPPEASGRPTVRLGTLAPAGSSFHQILLRLRDRWRQAPEGGVELVVYAGGSLGGEAAMVQKMNVGAIQAGMLSVEGLTRIHPPVAALQNLPMMFRDWREVEHVREKLGPELEKGLRERGFVVLFWGDAGWVRWFSREPLAVPADLKGRRIFVWAGNEDQVDMMKQAGYQPVPLETNDILPGLQTGLIQVVAMPPVLAVKSQVFTVAPHMLDLDWAPLVGGLVVTSRLWDSLSPALQAALAGEAARAGAEIRARARAEADEAVAAMRKRGLQVRSPGPEEVEEWRRAAAEFYPRIRGRLVPAEMYDRVAGILAELRAGKKEK